MNYPTVSVIIAVKNGARFLGHAIASVRAQTWPNIETIVVDGGSTDGSREIAASFPDVRLVSQQGDGFAGAWNEGIQKSCGDYIAFLDSDDLWAPSKLTLQMEALKENEKCDYILASTQFISRPGMLMPLAINRVNLSTAYAAPFPSALLARRSLFSAIGLFDEALKMTGDIDWFRRLRDEEFTGLTMCEILVYRRIHECNLSYFPSDRSCFNRELLDILKSSLDRRRRKTLTQENHTVSVIVPVYNDGLYLGEALESILSQTYPPAEVIVVDDGSIDNSSEVAMNFGQRIQLHRLSHRGAGAARNYGVSLAKSELLAFLDADDRWAPVKLERQIEALKVSPDLEAVFAHLEHFYSPELSSDQRRKLVCPSEALKCTTAVAMLIRKTSFERVGGFDESGRLGEVVDWYLRARQAGLIEITLDDVLVQRRIHRSNTGILRTKDRSHYVDLIKATLDQRRSAEQAKSDPQLLD